MNLSFLMGSSRLGAFGLIWSLDRNVPKVNRIILSRPEISAGQIIAKQYAGMMSATCAEMDQITGQIKEVMEGKPIVFDLAMIRLDLCSLFQQHVLRAEHRVPRGSVTTYQRLAQYLGTPKAVRAVGNALANNPFPIIIPCHRAIRSDRTLGGFQGGLGMKRILLEQEGHEITSRMRVINPRLHY
jgi:methylated-DNA-[protein]-cysteine S-methyltransferase